MRRGYVVDGVLIRGGGYTLKGQAKIQREKEEQSALEAQVVGVTGAPERGDYGQVSAVKSVPAAVHATHATERSDGSWH